ncbi:MAG TPA: hypothetical protein VGH13_20370 [Xanthobacteraceae bacterium]|jgi:hypothetical protein
MLNSAAEEISQWAERCRIWARGARTPEQRALLEGLENVLSQAAKDAQRDLHPDSVPDHTPKKS